MGKMRLGGILDGVVHAVCTLVMTAMVLLTVVDVAGRYLFRSPVPGGFEVTELLLALVIFAGLPVVSKDETHIAVDMFTAELQGRSKRVQCIAVNLLNALIMGSVSVFLALKAADVSAQNDVTPYLKFPLGPAAYFMCISCALTALIFIANAKKHLTGKDLPPSGPREPA